MQRLWDDEPPAGEPQGAESRGRDLDGAARSIQGGMQGRAGRREVRRRREELEAEAQARAAKQARMEAAMAARSSGPSPVRQGAGAREG